jgi:3-oxoacyl-[acyl-carrier-protein] synthase II
MHDVRHRSDVVITGLGVISPIGLNRQELVESLSTSWSGVAECSAPPLARKFPAAIVPSVFDGAFTRLELPYFDRCQKMAVIAAAQAITDAGFSDFSGYGIRAGLFYGNVRGGAATTQDWLTQLLVEDKPAARPFTAMALMHNAGAAHISIRHRILGPVVTHGSACASSATAAGEALRAIRDGYLDVAVVGGAEAPLTAAEFGLFEGTRAMAEIDPQNAGRSCKPFSKSRTGMVLGEGAAFLVLESTRHAQERGAACYARLSGYGTASDGYHIGQPNSDGQAAAILAALADAGLRPEDIGYFNAHGTATRGGDGVEARAIRKAFGTATDRVHVSSTKSVHGHLLGAASALELVITVAAMTESLVPATAHLDEVAPECELNHVRNTPLQGHAFQHAMSFSCGFGGTNAALVVSRPTEGNTRRAIDAASIP